LAGRVRCDEKFSIQGRLDKKQQKGKSTIGKKIGAFMDERTLRAREAKISYGESLGIFGGESARPQNREKGPWKRNRNKGLRRLKNSKNRTVEISRCLPSISITAFVS
jgi:hypothetical protein